MQSDPHTTAEVELGHVPAPRTRDDMIVTVESSGSRVYTTLRRRFSADPVELDPREAMQLAELLLRAAHLATLAEETGDDGLVVAAATTPA